VLLCWPTGDKEEEKAAAVGYFSVVRCSTEHCVAMQGITWSPLWRWVCHPTRP